jgi:FSR family fosmidomycin resistance protein-like MFS transporter
MSEAAAEQAGQAALETERAGPSRGRVLATLTACHSVNDFYAMVVPPLLPALREAFALTYAQAGAVPFVSTGLSAVLQPTLGYVADRRAVRKPLMIAGFLVLAAAAVLLGQTTGFVALLLAAAVLGLGQSTYHAQSATFLTYHFRQGRGLAQGIHGIGNGIGFILAPVAVTLLATALGWRSAALALAIPALVAAGLVHFLLREPAVRGHAGFLAGITRPLLLLTVVNGLALASTSGFMTWLPSFYRAQGQTLLVSGVLTAAMSVATLVAQPLGGTLSDRLGRRTVIALSLASTGALLAAFVAAPRLELMVLLSVLIGFCGSLLPPVTMVYASELAAGERTGMAVGVVWGLGTAFSAFSPLATGALIDVLGFGTAYLGLAGVAVCAAALATLLPRRT